MEYNFNDIEKKWQQYWANNHTFSVKEDKNKEKFYVLDMFPYPSGAGLHVGHPLGYIASDIFARFKRLKGYNVLHPMGFDAYGLPAEQYAIQTGQHPAITTQTNIKRYKEQLNKIGLSYDWAREVRTCDPKYYKWTQWIFIQLFNSYYDNDEEKALPIEKLVDTFQSQGTKDLNVACSKHLNFSSKQWDEYSEKEKSEVLMNYRLAYLSESMVNWCKKLGTVLANDEVVNGLSVRGGYPVERKPMQQWSLRITAYAERLLKGLDNIQWSDSIKEIQRYWIGKSRGCIVNFHVATPDNDLLEVFTTRADTIFGVTFVVISPEHPLVEKITTKNYEIEVKHYIEATKHKSELERTAETKTVSGIFTGNYAINPLTGKQIPIYISDYVLMGYGTGAIMAVPAHDSRDFAFAKRFMLPIIQVVLPDEENESNTYTWKNSKDSKSGKMIHSGFLNGLDVKDAIKQAIEYIESHNLGYATTNYRLRDAIFSRQRYWGEPFPVYYKDNIPYTLQQEDLPLCLPEIDKFLPTETGEPPLARALNWQTKEGYRYETNTMPGFAGSNAYSIRYMDPNNEEEIVSKETNKYWQNVDLYVGGSEHATGHLLYSRFITKFLFDIGSICKDEPYKRLVNQGMIQGKSSFVYRIKGENKYVSLNLKDNHETDPIHIDISLIENGNEVNIEKLRHWREEFKQAEFILEDGKYICGFEVEKMSKSLYNVINPDSLIEKYGADTLRLYEMFLGPIEQSKPWDVQGIEGVSRFMKKFWKLYCNEQGFCVTEDKADQEEMKILHRTIKKIEDDIERFSLNTCISEFMIITNFLTDKKCHKKAILEPLVILIAPFAPHIAEELWCLLGHNETISFAQYPVFDPNILIDSKYKYPVSINGKTRTFVSYPLDKDVKEIENEVITLPELSSHLEGKTINKIIFVKGKIINIVIR
ncbi:MAG: leucine--tRNA ligase [Bacteroidales bacterium]